MSGGGGIIIINGRDAAGQNGTPSNIPVGTAESFVSWCSTNGVPSEYAAVISALNAAITQANS